MTQTPAPSAAPKTSGMAIASLVCGILGFCTAGIASLIGLVLGIVAIKKVNSSGGVISGRGLAIGGIILSVVSLMVGAYLALVFIFFGLVTGQANMQFQEKANIDTTKAVISEVESALDVYNAHVGHYPTEEEGGLTALRVKPNFETEAMGDNWHGPYLRKDPVDAWSRPLHYELVQATASGTGGGRTTTQTVHIWSDGPDRLNGTADDIKNWSDDMMDK